MSSYSDSLRHIFTANADKTTAKQQRGHQTRSQSGQQPMKGVENSGTTGRRFGRAAAAAHATTTQQQPPSTQRPLPLPLPPLMSTNQPTPHSTILTLLQQTDDIPANDETHVTTEPLERLLGKHTYQTHKMESLVHHQAYALEAKEEGVIPTWLQVTNQIEPVLAQRTDVANKFEVLKRSFGCEALNLLAEHYRTAKSELQDDKARTEQLIANKIEAESDATAKARQTSLVRTHAADLKRNLITTRMANESRRRAKVNEPKHRTPSARLNRRRKPYEAGNGAHGNNTERTRKGHVNTLIPVYDV